MIEICPSCGEKVFFTNSMCPACGTDRSQSPAISGVAAPPAAATGTVESSPLATCAALALIALAVFSFFHDWAMVSNTGSLDFRNRVTGLRLLASGQDPYHYKWQRGGPERLCDVYENPKLPITKTTVSPAMLITGWPMALLPYPVCQMLWLITQWALLAALWWIWFKWPGQTPQRQWCWTLLVVGFSFTLGWRKHVDNGQAYLVWAVLLSLWQRLSLVRTAKRPGLAGLLAGLLVCLRPPLLLVVAPFLVLRRREQWLGAVVGLMLGLGVPALLRPTVWQEYARAMDTWSNIHRTYSNPRPGLRAVPPTIEGIPVDRISAFKVIQFTDSSVYGLFRELKVPPMPALPVLGVLGFACACWWWVFRKAGDAVLLGGLAAWAYLTDMFLPAYRYPYNDVMILAAFAMIPTVRWMERTSLALALFSIVIGICLVSYAPPSRAWVYLPTYAMIAFVLFMLFRSVHARVAAANPAAPP